MLTPSGIPDIIADDGVRLSNNGPLVLPMVSGPKLVKIATDILLLQGCKGSFVVRSKSDERIELEESVSQMNQEMEAMRLGSCREQSIVSSLSPSATFFRGCDPSLGTDTIAFTRDSSPATFR